jgi:hypothetical protein
MFSLCWVRVFLYTNRHTLRVKSDGGKSRGCDFQIGSEDNGRSRRLRLTTQCGHYFSKSHGLVELCSGGDPAESSMREEEVLKIVAKVIGLILPLLWLGVIYFIFRKFRRNWQSVKDTVKNARDMQSKQPTVSPGATERPKVNSAGIVSETLEESLAKHRKQMDDELARLMKRKSQSK